MKLPLLVGMIGYLSVASVLAQPVGETHRVTSERTARLRDAQHRDLLRITVWYSAAADAVEGPVVEGPPTQPLFDIGAVAPNAHFATDNIRQPVLLLSHGFGGTARIMGWFGLAMARAGYIVIAVDHPGSNAIDEMTVPGAILWWDRAKDLQSALEAAVRDATIGPHMDTSRIGVAGFSAGGFTALVAAGALADPTHLDLFCRANPEDGVCRPQQEFSFSSQDLTKTLARPEIAAEEAHAGEDHSIHSIRAAFAMAPALVQALDPASLARMHTPVFIMLGDADTVAPPSTNGLVAAKLIPGAQLKHLPGVGHYDFLSTCTQAGQRLVPRCKVTVPQTMTHSQTIAAAEEFFSHVLESSR
jgi:predicted dienelactone hydrolase